MYNTLLAIVLLAFCGCGSGVMSSKEEIIEIRLNDFTKERRYYNENRILIGIIQFKTDKTKGGRTPIDSVRYDLSSTGELLKVNYFNYENGRYTADTNNPIQNYYEALFKSISGCGEIKSVNNAYILLEASNDICAIASSVLSNGQEASAVRKERNDSSLNKVNKTVTYDSLNSIFIGLSEEVQSHFFQQPLKTLVIAITNNFLSKEDYYFSEGQVTREYIYKKGKLSSVIVTTRRNDGETEKIIKQYSFRQYPSGLVVSSPIIRLIESGK